MLRLMSWISLRLGRRIGRAVLHLIAIARELNLPIRYIGVGEKVEDLLPFDSEKFIESLFEK